MIVAIVIVIIVIVVLAGLLVYNLVRSGQQVVPGIVDRQAAHYDRVVGTDAGGNAVTESQEPPEEPRDDGPFEAVLKDELDDLGRGE